MPRLATLGRPRSRATHAERTRGLPHRRRPLQPGRRRRRRDVATLERHANGSVTGVGGLTKVIGAAVFVETFADRNNKKFTLVRRNKIFNGNGIGVLRCSGANGGPGEVE